MPVSATAKIVGHVIVSVALTLLIYGAGFELLIFLWGDLPSPESPPPPAFMAAAASPLYVALGALIAQWHRHLPVATRLLSFIFFCVTYAVAAMVALLPVPDDIIVLVPTVGLLCALIVSLVTLRTIEFPWPIPLVRLWRGEIGLAQTYWMWISLVVASLTLLSQFVLQLLYDLTGSFFIIALKAAVGLLVSTFSFVAIWRSAGAYKGPRRWLVLARATVVIFVLFNLVYLAGLFLEIPLVGAMQ